MKKLLLIFILMLVSVVSGTTRFVNTVSSGGDGTTNATTGANAAYSCLSNAITAYNGTPIVTGKQIGRAHV